MHHAWANTFLQITLLGVCTLDASQAQVKCTMPNGVVITQHLSDKCPAGATKKDTIDGKSLPIPPAPVVNQPPTRDPLRQQTPAEALGSKWPLTVTDVVLRCEPLAHPTQKLGIVTAVHQGTTYSVNGLADSRAASRGWRMIHPIWKANPEVPGTKMNIGPLIDYGLQLCR